MPKTIFGTSEKSNFILNMKSSTLQKWIAAMLMLCVIVPQIGNFFITAFDASNSFLASFLYFTGFGSILFFIITMMKKEITLKENKIYIVVFVMAVLAFASYYGAVIFANAESLEYGAEFAESYINTALMGALGRYEGLLSLWAYFGIFLLATAVTNKKTIYIIMDIIVGMGIVQAVIAVFQHIPGLDFLTKYSDLPTLALRDVMLSSGLSDSPIFYGSFLTIVTGVAFAGALFDKNNKRALVYGLSALLFWLTGLFTSSVVPIIGICSVIVIMTVVVIVKQKNGGVKFECKVFDTALKRYAAIVLGMTVIFVLVYIFQGIYIRDKAIAFYDGMYRLFIALGYSPVDKASLYETAWGRSIDIIKEHPLLGVGPDCLAKYQTLYEKYEINLIDKSYNEYLYIAATRGIPSLIAYIAFIVYVLKRSKTGTGSEARSGQDWYMTAIFVSVGAYLVQAFFSASSVTVAPLFWLLAGFACANKISEVGTKKSKKAKNKLT